jgi:hypothetical protein
MLTAEYRLLFEAERQWGNSALRPTCAPKRLHQEQKDLKRSLVSSGLERSDKNNRPAWPCDRAVLNPS